MRSIKEQAQVIYEIVGDHVSFFSIEEFVRRINQAEMEIDPNNRIGDFVCTMSDPTGANYKKKGITVNFDSEGYTLPYGIPRYIGELMRDSELEEILSNIFAEYVGHDVAETIRFVLHDTSK